MKKIILACAAGMSTSMLVERMCEEAKQRGLDVEIVAIPESSVSAFLGTESQGIGCVLIGPQIRFQLEQIKGLCDPYGIKVESIDFKDYGLLNGKAVLDQALALF